MRILIATQYRTVVGGVETYLRCLIPRLTASKHEVALLTATPLFADGEDILAGVVDVPVWDAAGAADAIAWRPDVVYEHGLISASLYEPLFENFPVVSFLHNYVGTCISGTKCTSWPTSKPCERVFGPACLALYLPLRCGGLNPVTAVRQYFPGQRRQRTLVAARTVIAASQHMADEMIRNGVPAERAYVVPYPLTATRDTELPQRRPMNGRILFVGRITQLKGWRHLVKAIPLAEKALGRKLVLVVAGDGPDKTAFEQAARHAGLNAKFLGWITPERREAEMRKADVLAVPSVWPEPFGLVGPEAGCVGLPAVAYAVGGIPEWLTAGVTGELAPGVKPDPAEYAAALVRALRDEDHHHALRVGAWEATRRLVMDSHLDRLLPLLH